jgi:hypothetical protein
VPGSENGIRRTLMNGDTRMSDTPTTDLSKKDLEAAFAGLGPAPEPTAADKERARRIASVEKLVGKLASDLVELGVTDGDLAHAAAAHDHLGAVLIHTKESLSALTDAKLTGGAKKAPRKPRQPRSPKPAAEVTPLDEKPEAEPEAEEHREEEAKAAPTGAPHFEPAPREDDEPEEDGEAVAARIAEQRAERGAPTGRPPQQRSSQAASSDPRGATDPNLGDGF